MKYHLRIATIFGIKISRYLQKAFKRANKLPQMIGTVICYSHGHFVLVKQMFHKCQAGKIREMFSFLLSKCFNIYAARRLGNVRSHIKFRPRSSTFFT